MGARWWGSGIVSLTQILQFLPIPKGEICQSWVGDAEHHQQKQNTWDGCGQSLEQNTEECTGVCSTRIVGVLRWLGHHGLHIGPIWLENVGGSVLLAVPFNLNQKHSTLNLYRVIVVSIVWCNRSFLSIERLRKHNFCTSGNDIVHRFQFWYCLSW